MLSNILILRWLRVMLWAGEERSSYDQSLTSKIEAAYRVLIAEGKVDAVDEFFTTDCVAHGPITRSTATVRSGSSYANFSKASLAYRSKSRFS
jgi:hypothetical protein